MNIPDWITINPEMNFGKPSENYATEVYVGGRDYLILEIEDSDYPRHYITLRQSHEAAPFRKKK